MGRRRATEGQPPRGAIAASARQTLTEQEWFAAQDVAPMLAWLGERPGARKLRLFGCACLRLLGEDLSWEAQECVKYVEKAGDGFLRWPETVARVRKRTSAPDLRVSDWFPACLLASSPATAAADAAYLAGIVLAHGIDQIQRLHEPLTPYYGFYQSPSQLLEIRDLPAYTTRLTPILRDIVGNPFRPVTFDPCWRTYTTVAMARQMDESRDFGPLPILADALQDAGCEHSDILAHCRDPQGVHIRGCWLVDLVLGKS